MFKKLLVLGLLVYGLTSSANAGSVTFGDIEPINGISVSSVEDLDGTIITYHVTGFETENIYIDGKPYAKILMKGTSVNTSIGNAELPYQGSNFTIPANSNPKLIVLSSTVKKVKIGNIVPSKGPMVRYDNPSFIPYTFSKTYGKINKPTIKMSKPFWLRDLQGVTLTFQPLSFDGSTGISTLTTDLVVKISTPKTFKMAAPLKDSSEFMSLYKSSFKNFYAPMKGHFVDERPKLLIISHQNFKEALEPFVTWKRQRGYEVKLVTNTEVGAAAADIKSFIQNEFNTSNIGYVILVGDAEFIPYYPGTAGNAYGKEADPMYTLVKGDDSYPDLFISRMSVKTVEDTANIINRSINYEKNPDLTGTWYRAAMGIASSEGSPTDAQRADKLRTSLLAGSYQSVDQIYDPSAVASMVANGINSGRGFINYIGHGSSTAWVTSNFSNSSIDALDNGMKMPFIVSVACVNGQFAKSGGDAFAERWLKAGTTTAPKGAIAIFASSTNQAWVPPTIGQAKIVELLMSGQATTIGGLFTNGSIAVLEDNSSEAAQTFQTWHIFGDATLQARTTTPEAITASIPDFITVDNNFIVTTIVGTTVTLVQDGRLIGATTSVTPQTLVKLTGNLEVNKEAVVTITGFNKIPVIKTVMVK